MSLTNLCRLCLKGCNDCKSLYNETGKINEIYEITVKYFHPMFLSVDQKNQKSVMCLECWHHILDFYSYQQSVLEAQRKLLEEDSQTEFKSGQCTSTSGIAVKKEADEDSMSFPDIELMEDSSLGDDPPNSTAYSPENLYGTGINNIKDELIDIPETAAQTLNDHSTFDDSILEGSDTFKSDGNQMTSPIKRKRANRKSQTELDSFISQWRPSLECVVCGVPLTSFTLLQRHFCQEHPNEQCYISCCSRKFFTRGKIEEHARFHTDPNAFKCLKCGSKLGSEASLYTHSRKCHTSKEDLEPLRNPQRAKRQYTKTPLEEIDNFIALYKPNLECVVCHESCPRFTLLKTHFRKNHPGEEGYVTCCQRKFISRSALKEHIWLHMDPNAFKCNICDRHQSTYKSLQTHMERVHSTPQKNIRLKDIRICTVTKANVTRSLNGNINLQKLGLDCSTSKNSRRCLKKSMSP